MNGDGPNEQSRLEPVPVQLTRMEGTINLIAYQFGEMKEEVQAVRTENVQQLARIVALELRAATSSGIHAAWKTWVPILLAFAGVLAAFGVGIKVGG